MSDNPTSMRVPDAGVRSLFTLESRWQAWLDVEAALAKAEAELDVIPQDAAAVIVKKSKLDLLDRANIEEGLIRTAHPLVPLIWELARVCGEEAGGYVHWGATTQNITQTGQLLLLRQAHKIVIGQLGRILSVMADLAERTKDMALPGRTHGQHAVPATFGFKVGNWIDELCRHVERFREAEPRVFVAMLGGAAGTFASFGDLGPKIQAGMAVHLDMKPMSAPARTIGDHQAEYVCLLGMLASTCSKVAREIYTQMKQEFGEVEEPVPPGTVGSSTMPQNRNPKRTQDMVAAAAQVRALVPLALEAMQTEHEADRTTSLMISHALQDACGQTGDILSRMETMLEGLQVDEARMRQNLDLSGGLIMGEALMLSLGANIGRQEAHDAIYEAAQAAATTDETFQSLLAKDDTVRAHMSTDQIAELLDPTAYTGQCAAIAIEQAARAREVAKRLEGIAS